MPLFTVTTRLAEPIAGLNRLVHPLTGTVTDGSTVTLAVEADSPMAACATARDLLATALKRSPVVVSQRTRLAVPHPMPSIAWSLPGVDLTFRGNAIIMDGGEWRVAPDGRWSGLGGEAQGEGFDSLERAMRAVARAKLDNAAVTLRRAGSLLSQLGFDADDRLVEAVDELDRRRAALE